jgi:hypothetical protein
MQVDQEMLFEIILVPIPLLRFFPDSNHGF